MQAMVKVLQELGVNLSGIGEHKAYKFKANGFMDFNAETWKEGERKFIALSHYGIQNGDSMADPDVLCEVRENNFVLESESEPEKKLIPVHFQNDYVGIFQQARIYEGNKVLVSPSLTKSINSFLSQWAKNIKAQGFKAE